MADLSSLPRDFLVTSIQFTQNAHHDAYPAIDLSLPEHSLFGKVTTITGASRGIRTLVSLGEWAHAPWTGVVEGLLTARLERQWYRLLSKPV